MSDLSAPKSGRLSGRTREEIDRDFRENCRKGAESILRIGYDLAEMKALCEHGEWLEWLKSVEWSERTAQNYMRVAKSWDQNPKLMAMGYTRTVALLAAPAEVQEMAADGQLDNASAAEIRRLSKELKEAKDEAESYKQIVRNQQHSAAAETREKGKLQKELQELREREQELREREPEVRIVEKIPDDYELLKRQLRLAEDAAEDAERRAAEAVQQAQEAMAGEPDPCEGPSVTSFLGAVNSFLAASSLLPYAEEWLRTLSRDDRKSVKMYTDSIWHWAENMLKALEADRLVVIPGEGAVSGE